MNSRRFLNNNKERIGVHPFLLSYSNSFTLLLTGKTHVKPLTAPVVHTYLW